MQIVLGCGSHVLVNVESGSSTTLFVLPFFASGSFSGALILKDLAAIGNLGTHAFQHRRGFVVNLVLLAFVIRAVLFSRNFDFPCFEKSWLSAGITLAVIAAVHLTLTGIRWGLVMALA